MRNIDTLVNWVIEDNKDGMRTGCLNSLNLVLSNVEKMDLLIKGILDYLTIDKLEAVERQINFNFLIDDSLRVIEVPKNIQISVQKNLPIMHGNAWRFKQVFRNLIQNAIKYNDKAIGKTEFGSVERKNLLEFFIKDNGMEIDSIYF